MSPSTKKLVSLVKKCLKLLLDPSTAAGAPAAAPHHEEEEDDEFRSTLSSSSRSSSYSCFRRRSSSSSLFDVGSSSPAASSSTRTVASWDYYTDSPKLRSWRNSYDSHDSSWTNVEEEEEAASDSCCPWDVPHGCLAVYVGGEQRRFVIQTEFLHHSLFRTLLAKSEEEFGFDNPGGLRIACEPDVFQLALPVGAGNCSWYSWLITRPLDQLRKFKPRNTESQSVNRYHDFDNAHSQLLHSTRITSSACSCKL